MNMKKYDLWKEVPGTANTTPYIMHYQPEEKKTDSVLLIIPGSGYAKSPSFAPQEGERVAKWFCEKGINVFVLEYRVAPDKYPMPLLDGRRAVRYIRYHSEKFKINKNRIAAMGYSSGGHLTASLFAYHESIDFENIDDIDKESFVPDFQILCYPVISLDRDNYYTHMGSVDCLLAEKYDDLRDLLSLEKSQIKKIAPTFIWHNFDDKSVNVVNSLKYAENLQRKGTAVEMHIYPDGGHGIGLPVEDRKDYNHNKEWINNLEKWLEYNGFFEGVQ